MLFVYPAVFHCEDGSIWVEFPDLPGCHTYGSSITETMKYAQEAMTAHILTLLDTDEELSPPSDIQTIKCDEDSFTTLVTCEVNSYKDTTAVKKTLTLPAWLNERALAMDINFSQALQDALLSIVLHGIGKA